LFLQAERLLGEELRGYGVDARTDRLTSSRLRAAKSAIKAKRKQHPKVQHICNINYAIASKERD
jgi:hypothetical protein